MTAVIRPDAEPASGDVEAMLSLGKKAFAGRSPSHSRQDGARLLVSAAELGSREADCLISVIIAIDATEPKDWSLALGYIQRAAERGSGLARAQLCLLAEDRELAAALSVDARAPESDAAGDLKDWERLRDTIDLPARLKVPPLEPVLESPRIRILRGFASAQECSWMIASGGARMKRAEVFDQIRGGRVEDRARSNSAAQFGFLEMDFVLALLRARVTSATGFSRPSLEETNVLHYAAGQEFSRHFDFYDPAQPANAAEIRQNGQRIATFLVYLNEDFDDGETDFPALEWRHRGKTGDAVFFMNVDDDVRPDRRTMHAGLPPGRGEKWLLSQWIRGVPGAGL